MIDKVRSVLDLPWAYQMWDSMLGSDECRRGLVREYIRPKQSDRILDIGCGPGSMVPYLPKSEYIGFDANPEYIKRAQRRFPGASFICDRICEYNLTKSEYFDIVVAVGIVHHLNDVEAVQLFRIANQALKPDGKLFTLDGVWVPNQSRLVRFLLSKDRGSFVRCEEAYVELAAKSFSNIKPVVRHDMLRIPYTHLVLECRR